jgi:hypothetical protein
MVKPSDIGWGKYKKWEGPLYYGGTKFVLPSKPTDEEKIIAVITATEGGSYSAINMYDSCVLSSGLIQWCEAHYFVSSMLGAVAEKDPALLTPLDDALRASSASFKKRSDGKWRFFFTDKRGEVNSAVKQQSLFLGGSNGLLGSWNEESILHAKTWAAGVASVWEDQTAQRVQTSYTASRLGMFVTKDAKAILFGPNAPRNNDGFSGAVRAAFYSFAANLPAVASEQLRFAASQSHAPIWSEAWAIEIIKQMTLGPKIPIYPGRYNKIRPVIESMYGVDLPDLANDLAQWYADMNSTSGTYPEFFDIKEIQEELIAGGYDIGPRGADGVFGMKTKQALAEFQSSHGLVADGIMGPNTRRAMSEAHIGRVSNVR